MGSYSITASGISNAALVLIALSTIPSIWRLAKRTRRGKTANEPELYEDEDGAASAESQALYSTRRHFIAIFVLLGLGLATSLGLAIVATVRKDQSRYSSLSLVQLWLLFPSWILLLLQILETSLESNLRTRFSRGAFNLFSCGLIAIVGTTLLFGHIPTYPDDIILSVIVAAQVVGVIALACVLFSVKRRPDVYRPDGSLVERQYTSSLWARYTYSWATDILDEAAVKQIDAKDLPYLNAANRSQDFTASFHDSSLKPTTALWVLILWRLRYSLVWQWLVVVASCFFDVGPQFAMLKLLQFLESRQGFDAIDSRAWLWVGLMLFVTVGSTIIDARIMWALVTDIMLPIRSLLTTLLFEKMIRMKDIKAANQPDEDASKEDSKDGGSTTKTPEDDKPKSRQTQQEVVNMFTMDTMLVAAMTANSQMYINFLVRLILCIAFLWLLVGWPSMIAGMTSIAITFPVNEKLGGRYGRFQRALMKARDKKTRVVTEALKGIRQIKFSAIEDRWAKKIDEAREDELQTLWSAKLATVFMELASDLTPVLFAIFTLATYSYLEGDLLPSVAFTALSLFIQLEGLTGMLPYLMTMGYNASVSLGRIEKFLHAPEKLPITTPGTSISFHSATVSFPTDNEEPNDEAFTLRDISLDFPNNALSVISGPTGSGKSLLLAAILGEAELNSGYITVPTAPSIKDRFDSKATAANWIIPSAVAYIAQTPWIENATIKNNILFGLPDDPIRYEKVIKACALTKDLDMFDDGDSTEVGAQGISLSGGQKWRLTLARAFYSRAGILILDDVFSALDAHVGKEIYDKALMGELAQGRTRILVTHHVALCLPRAKYAVRLGARGTLEHAGLVEDLKQSGSFEDILKAERNQDGETASGDELESSGTTLLDVTGATVTVIEDVPAVPKATPKKLVEDEKRETGSVKRNVYTQYLHSTGGVLFWGFVLVIYFLAQFLTMSRSYWIKIWTSSYEHVENKFHMKNSTLLFSYGKSMQSQLFAHPKTAMFPTPKLPSVNTKLAYYLGVYAAISLVSIVVSAFRFYFVYKGGLRGSRKLFRQMTHTVLRTPLRWLDTVPLGRILNRFTADFQNIDGLLSMNFSNLAACALQMIGVLAAAFFISPMMLIVSVILLGTCAQMGRRFLRGARTIKRLESIQKSPMISHFSSTLEGISTIRAFGSAPVFVDRMYVLIDTYTVSTWHNWMFNNWVSLRMSMVGSFFSAAVAAFIVSTHGIDASLAGFALAFALDYSHAAMRVIKLIANVELDMNATERIYEYTDLEVENQGGIENLRASWPEEGKLEVTGLEVGYAEDLPSILKGLTFKADSNQRIGVVGRTGAGKSTLSLALFRFLEARKGSIIIDGIDISTIKLHDLRTRLAIIPQDPVLFSGTIRSNLDPFNEFSDHQVKEVLSRVHLTPSVDNTPIPELLVEAAPGSSATSTTATAPENKENANIFLDLSSPISSAGTNISQGQKQLLCLARAILSRPRLLILDEATSAVDMVTDALIQRSIREEFANTTLLVVAHRLSTVADFDRILVMSDGVAAEFGSPKELLGIDEGVFRGMVAQSGESEALEKTIWSS